MSVAFAAQTRVELWTSFASLLRSYCAAHGLNSPHQAVVEVSAESITIRVADRWMVLAENHGTILVTRADGLVRTLELNEDGTMTANGSTQEMDMVAEQLAREIFQA